MLKKLVIALSLITLTTACSPKYEEEEIVQDNKKGEEKAIIPKYSISDEYYRTILPFKEGKARGLITSTVDNRLDLDELDTGLMRLSTEHYDTAEYFYQEGQYISSKIISEWLGRKDGDANGLNPALPNAGTITQQNEKSPKVLSHVLEHNYLRKNRDNQVELAGISIALSLNSVHYYKQEQGYPREYKIPHEEIDKKGKELADTVLKRIRKIKGLEDIPVMIALFKEEPRYSITPGSYFAKTYVKGNSSSIDKWEKVDEQYYLFPSEDAKKNYFDDSTKMLNFKADVEEYFPNFVGVIGNGFYKNGQLQEMTINIPVQFFAKAEIIGFTEYVAGLVMDHFSPYISVNVYINTIEGPEAIIIRKRGDEKPIVHVYN